ncbi:MAG: zinc ribbon domain-containing protein, partial [Anaerolineae bacterium]|nr:zinc ribbon domain-containing protein [Anaerolineae bacterium]
MAEKELGYVELEWRCPSCGTRNPGSVKKCRQCGTALTEEIQFEQAPQEELITDEAKIAQARAGPDIQCAYCGTANPATARTCKQCGADLAEGKARQAGQVLGAFREQPAPPLKCPACGKENPATALKCAACGAALVQPTPQVAPAPAKARGGIGILIAILLGLCVLAGLFFALSSRTSETIGQVSDVSWRRAIAIEALTPVTRQAWRDEIPANAPIGQCTRKVHHTEPNPVPGAREVCGTPYTVD